MILQTNHALPNAQFDEFDCYLADGVVPTDNPLKWWLMNRKVYPNLAWLATSVHSAM
ncbi:hypothetical protein BT96DRAFT_878008, partial [Gymnopus androsaceus JB14]